MYCVPFKRLTHLKAVECIFSTLTVVWIAVPRIHKNVLWSNFCGEFDLDYFGKYALEQLPFLRIARAMCYLCMGRVLDWERMHKSFSDEFCDPTKILSGRPKLPSDLWTIWHSTW